MLKFYWISFVRMYDNGRKQQRFCIIKLTRFNDVQAGSTRNRGVSLGTMRMCGTRWTTRRVDRWERTCLSRVAPKYTLLLSFVAIISPSIYLSMYVCVYVCLSIDLYINRYAYISSTLHTLYVFTSYDLHTFFTKTKFLDINKAYLPNIIILLSPKLSLILLSIVEA